MDEVLQLMLAVAHFDPRDAEVQEVLGVLQNVTQDLDAAAGAFQKAFQQNPQDFSLLNKVSHLAYLFIVMSVYCLLAPCDLIPVYYILWCAVQ
jgi:hypothetical protein